VATDADSTQMSVVKDSDTTESTSRGIAFMIAHALINEQNETSKNKWLEEESLNVVERQVPTQSSSDYWSKIADEQKKKVIHFFNL